MIFNTFMAYDYHQRQVKEVLDTLTGEEKIECFSGVFENEYITILKIDDEQYKWTQEVI